MPPVMQTAMTMLMDKMHVTYRDRTTIMEPQPFIKAGTMQAILDISENVDSVSALLRTKRDQQQQLYIFVCVALVGLDIFGGEICRPFVSQLSNYV